MQITSTSFNDGEVIPDRYAFAKPHPEEHFQFSDNVNPQLSWSDVPQGCKSLALLCIDPDAPAEGDDVNVEGKVVAKELPRTEFCHWVMVDIPPNVNQIAEGQCSSEVTPGGKSDPPGPENSRQGVNDYTQWFAGHPDLGGTYRGYDGPAPPWNDERIHRYQFTIYALDIERCRVDGDFTSADVRNAINDHILDQATITGTYTQNPNLR